MKLLFDQNISFRIVSKLKIYFPECTQVRLEGLENKSDWNIWEFAKINEFTIVTFDTDFYDISLIRGIPPKIIWLRFGNTSTSHLIDKLILSSELIKEFICNN
ncbi:MAG: DUF5615 family PIN-like protein, partial [Chitinophagaceae bacterium]|nr:DUF5615 family PIN-like protein [Chitinophagaceae bacterium]